MPQIGWLEILIIVSISIIVIGPKDFPIILKKVGSWIGSAKKYITNFQNDLSNLDENILDDKETIKNETNLDKEEK
tara:strand:- start:221 stop:448 length:228 start_codon:yes stop_codon:yes gene_type:complete